jgi:hypothetical protein
MAEMEPGSSKHTPRVDDQLQHETAAITHGAPDEGRTEGRRQEAPADGEPDMVLHRDDIDNEFSPDSRDVDRRAELAAALRPSDFPGTGAELAARAEDGRLPAEVLDALHALPEGRVYETVGEIWDDLNGNGDRHLRPGAHDPHGEGTV